MREGSEVVETSIIQRTLWSSLACGGLLPTPEAEGSCLLTVMSGSEDSLPISLAAEVPPLAIHLFGFNL